MQEELCKQQLVFANDPIMSGKTKPKTTTKVKKNCVYFKLGNILILNIKHKIF